MGLKKKRKRRNGLFDYFSSIFLIDKTEKKKVLNIVYKKDIDSFLFYTDYRNIPHILSHGIQQLKNMNLKGNEVYYVWSYLQHDESIDLEFDTSSRAYFWKWAGGSQMNPENMCVIAIDPIKLSKQTVEDWVYDTSLRTVSIHETVPRESISWIMLRQDKPIPKLAKYISSEQLEIDLFYGNGPEIKSRMYR